MSKPSKQRHMNSGNDLEDPFRPTHQLVTSPPNHRYNLRRFGEDSGYIPAESSIRESTESNEEASGISTPEQKVDISIMSQNNGAANGAVPRNNQPPELAGPFGGQPNNNNAPPAVPPAPQNNATNHNQLVSLKDALKCVPEFKGEPGTFRLFQEGCEEAQEMIDNNAEANFVRLLRSKISGDARKSLKGQTFDAIEGLVRYLKNMYFAPKPLYQLYGDLGTLHQRFDEKVISYVNRVREEVYKLIEAYTNEMTPTEAQLAAFKQNLEGNSISVFKKGLKPDIEQRITEGGNFAEVIQKAITAEKYLNDKDNLINGETSRNLNQYDRRRTYVCQLCHNEDHEAPICPSLLQNMVDIASQRIQREEPRVMITSRSEMKCQICNQTGHEAKECKNSEAKEKPKCQYCDKIGHMAKDCYSLKRLAKETPKCQYCDKTGHTAKDCFKLVGKCKICNSMKHTTEDCKVDTSKKCDHCKKLGHEMKNCFILKNKISKKQEANLVQSTSIVHGTCFCALVINNADIKSEDRYVAYGQSGLQKKLNGYVTRNIY